MCLWVIFGNCSCENLYVGFFVPGVIPRTSYPLSRIRCPYLRRYSFAIVSYQKSYLMPSSLRGGTGGTNASPSVCLIRLLTKSELRHLRECIWLLRVDSFTPSSRARSSVLPRSCAYNKQSRRTNRFFALHLSGPSGISSIQAGNGNFIAFALRKIMLARSTWG